MVILNYKCVLGFCGQCCLSFYQGHLREKTTEEMIVNQLDSTELFHGFPHTSSGNGAACIMFSNRTDLSGITI